MNSLGSVAELSIKSRAPEREMSCSTAGIDSLMVTGRSISLRGSLRFSALTFSPGFDEQSVSLSGRIPDPSVSTPFPHFGSVRKIADPDPKDERRSL